MKKSGASQGQSASELISKRIAELGDWRGETLSRMRKLIKEADPDVVEEWKWVKPTKPGTPVWSHDGIICTGESYKNVVKLTFAKGASLKDPARLFNSSLDGNVRRAIDIHEGEEVDESAFKALVRQAVALNSSGKSKPSKKGKPAGQTQGGGRPSEATTASQRARPPGGREAGSLAGGNPQIAKADGDAPVQAYIAAMPGWKRDVGRRLDALIVRTVPERAQGREVELALLWQSRARAGSSASIASRSTSRWLSSAARRCVLSPPASPSTRKCATSTSTRTTQLDEELWRAGFGRRRRCPAGTARVRRLFLVASLVAPCSALAHHSPAAFDQSAFTTIEGTVTEFRWGNPHVYFAVETTDSGGQRYVQEVEAGPASQLLPRGVTRDLLRPGDRVTVRANPNRRGPGNIVLGVELHDGGRLALSVARARIARPWHRRIGCNEHRRNVGASASRLSRSRRGDAGLAGDRPRERRACRRSLSHAGRSNGVHFARTTCPDDELCHDRGRR